MNVKFLRDTLVAGKRVKKDKTADVSEKDARYLIGSGKAEAADKSKAKTGKPAAQVSVEADI